MLPQVSSNMLELIFFLCLMSPQILSVTRPKEFNHDIDLTIEFLSMENVEFGC